MMRRFIPVALALALASCDDENGPLNRVVVPGDIVFQKKPVGFEMSPFRNVYLDADNKVAVFFVGDERGMSAKFVTEEGLVASERLLSAAERAGRNENDPAAKGSDGANAILGRHGLPDSEFKVSGAQQGYLLTYRYGKLTYVTYAAMDGGKLKLGSAADMSLLAQLAKAEGADGAFRTLPQVSAVPGQRPDRLLLFDKVPDQLGDILADNAGAIFREVTQSDRGWTFLDVPAPKFLADTKAIEAIRQQIKNLPAS